jgi:putative transposase
MLKTVKIRIYPNNKQKYQINRTFGICRYVYNWALNLKSQRYQEFKQNVNRFELSKMLTFLKSTEEKGWLNIANSQSLQSELKHLDAAYVNFFRKNSSFPKFKKKNQKQSFECPQNVKLNYPNKTIKLPKIGEIRYRDRFKFDPNIKVKTCVVSRSKTGKYFASILIDININHLAKTGKMIGIDLGLKHFATFSNNIKIENPRFLNKSLNKLKANQRKLSKKTKFSKNFYKQKQIVAKLFERINNQRNDFLHKLSTNLIETQDIIFVEDLNIEGMVKNHKLARSISDASWGEFIRQLEYKAHWYGKQVIKIGRFDPSSKMCSKCGSIKENLKLSDRLYICENCGLEIDRDLNAAINIKNFGLIKTTTAGHVGSKACGETLSVFTKQEAQGFDNIIRTNPSLEG